ncbi:MAG: menaquinone biosynthesis decarboxylase, partial [Bacteroidetes bacterium]|nr:menaquinone biosynthesis decarboxylase [Bacteroidota bacterium]
MTYSGLQSYIRTLDSVGDLCRIKAAVSLVLEIAEITDRVVKAGGPALLFENTGTEFPLLINAFGSDERMKLVLRRDYPEIALEIQQIFKSLTMPRPGLYNKVKMLPELRRLGGFMPVKKTGRGMCQQVVMPSPDLSKLPVLTCWPHDGGPFITLPLVHTVDPVTNIRNTGMYRMQVFDKTTTGMHWHLHKGSAAHFREYKRLGKKMPVSVVLGGDPVYTYVATAPLPEQVDEYILAGFLRSKKVELVKCLTNDLYIPSDADFVIEGFVDPEEEMVLEGPFGDHTGFYSLADYYPRFHVTCISHRTDAVYPATIVGTPPQEDAFFGKATERIFLTPIKLTMIPEVVDMHLPAEGVFHNLALVSVKNEYPGQAKKVISALWGAGQMMLNKVCVVFNENATLTNYKELLQNGLRNFDPASDIILSSGPADVLDHAARKFAYSGKLGIDLTCIEVEQIDNQDGLKSMPILISRDGVIIKQNFDLQNEGIPVGLLGIEKPDGFNVRDFADAISGELVPPLPKLLVLFDQNVDVSNYSLLVWLAGNNIDPNRDVWVIHQRGSAVLVIDATRKVISADG